MKRRDFIQKAITTIAAGTASKYASATTSTIYSFNPLTALKESQLYPGVYQSYEFVGCFLTAPGGYLNWYFNNIAIRSFIGVLSRNEIEAYLNSYMFNTKNYDNYRIIDRTFANPFDKNNPGAAGFVTVPPTYAIKRSDSDDSYAGTFISLVAAYVNYYNDNTAKQWLNNNLYKIKGIINNNIINTYKTGVKLTSTFQNSSITVAGTNKYISYLMDNCEVYRGLDDFSLMLERVYPGDIDLNTYKNTRSLIQYGIHAMFGIDSFGATKFFPSDDSSYNANYKGQFYPEGICQVFPQAYNVPSTDASTQTRYTTAYNYLNSINSTWSTQINDQFPWTILGFTAVLRGDYTRASNNMKQMLSFYDDPSSRGRVTISELAFYNRIKNMLPQNYW